MHILSINARVKHVFEIAAWKRHKNNVGPTLVASSMANISPSDLSEGRIRTATDIVALLELPLPAAAAAMGTVSNNFRTGSNKSLNALGQSWCSAQCLILLAHYVVVTEKSLHSI